ncbi:hypothetical protein SAMN02910453_1648 [Lachnospiraceae bacterium A10]|nr:hypothetical protein SAMN02910453_1648 [Lachnospiraceae bacterium A10]
MNNYDVVEIDLLMMIKKLLLQWKAILIVAIVFGIVGMNVQYAKAVADAKAIAQEEIDYESLLTEDELDAVDTAVSLNKKISDLELYISKSLLMSVDPLDYKQVSMVMTIHASAGTDARDIASLYVAKITSNEFVDQIIEGMDKNTTDGYVNNLMNVYHEKRESAIDTSIANTDQVNISVIVPKGWSGDKLAQIIQSAAEEIVIENYANQYTTVTDYVAVNEKSSFDLQQNQKAITDSVSTLKTQLSTAMSTFSENQTKLYEEKTAVEIEGENDDTEAVIAPQRSKKYFVLAAVMGIFLYVCVYGCVVMFGKVTSAELVSGTNVLATIYKPNGKKKFLAFLWDDRFLKKLLFKKEMDIDAKMQQVAQNLEIAMKSREKKEVYIVGSQFAAGELKSVLDQKLDSVKLNIVELGNEASISAFVKEVKAEDAYLIVLEDGITSKEDMMKLQSISSTGEIQNMGQIVVLE